MSSAEQTADSGVIRRARRIDGVGEIDLHIRLDNAGRISSVNISGDFFVLSELDQAVVRHLRGVPFTPADVGKALAGVDCSAIAGLTAESLYRLIYP